MLPAPFFPMIWCGDKLIFAFLIDPSRYIYDTTSIRRLRDEIKEFVAAENLDVSDLLLDQLTWLSMGQPIYCFGSLIDYHPSDVINVMVSLSNGRPLSTKKPRAFARKLEGYWHAHLFSARSLPWALRSFFTNLSDLEYKDLWREKIEPTVPFGTLLADEHLSFISASLTGEAISRISTQNRWTGNWLVYKKSASRLKFHLVSGHSRTSIDDDAILYLISQSGMRHLENYTDHVDSI